MIALVCSFAALMCLLVIPELGDLNALFDALAGVLPFGFGSGILAIIFLLVTFVSLYGPLRKVIANWQYERWYKSFNEDCGRKRSHGLLSRLGQRVAIWVLEFGAWWTLSSRGERIRASRGDRDIAVEQGPGDVAL